MSIRVSLLGLFSCVALVGLGSDRPGGFQGQPRDQAVPQLPSLVSFSLGDLNLPRKAGRPFTTTVWLDDEQYTLELEPYSLRADDFRLLVQGAAGELREVDAPPPGTYRGHVQGVPQSRVAASLIDGRLSATIALGAPDVWLIEPLSALTAEPVPKTRHVIYRSDDVIALEKPCGVADIDQPWQGGEQGDGQGGIAGTGIKIVDFAADADFEFYQKNNSSVPSTMFDIEQVMNGVESIYEDQTNITYEITTIVVRATSADPYSSSACVTLLNQFAATWNSSPESSIRRDVAQLFTGRNLADCLGIAVTPSVCNLSIAYSLVESRAPGITFTARVALSAHEVGHNWNAMHCCGTCSGCSPCRIMCPCIGGCSGIMTSFGTAAVNAIVNYSNSVSCLTNLPEPLDPPFFDDFPDPSLDTAKWIYNDGGFLTTAGVNEPSEPRSLNLDASGSGEYQDNEVRSNLIHLAGATGVVLSYYTQHRGVEEGEELVVEYWAEVILRWIELNRITSDGVSQDSFTFHVHDLPGAALNNEFRIRFRAEVNHTSDDWYIDDVFVGVPSLCPQDLDGDGSVGILDLLALLAAWGTDPGGPPDFDGDGTVGILDLLELLANWGPCP